MGRNFKRFIKIANDNIVISACSFFGTLYFMGQVTYHAYQVAPTCIEYVSNISESLESDGEDFEFQDINPEYNKPLPLINEYLQTNAILASSANLELSQLNYPESSWTV